MDGKTIALLIFCWGLLSGSLFGQSRPERIELAAEHHSLGAYYFYDDWDSTFYYTQLAAREREELFADSLCVDLGKSNYNAGYALRYSSKFAKARPYLERALAVFSSIDLPPEHTHRLPATHLELGRIYSGLGDYEKAKDQLKLTAAIINSAKEGDMVNLDDQYPASLSEYSGILMEQDSLDKAIAFSQAALKAYDALPYYYVSSLYARTNLANALNKRRDYAAAREEYASLIQPYTEEKDYYNLAVVQNNLADMLIKMGRLEEARQSLNAAKKAALASGDRSLLAQHQDHLGTLLEAEGKLRQATRAFQKAQALLLPEYTPESITEVPPLAQLKYASNSADLFLYINDQARTLDAMAAEEAEHVNALLALYRAGDTLLDELRKQHDSEASKFFWRQKALPFYEAAIRTCHLKRKSEDAFYFFEKSKAILLYEALAKNDALSELPDSLRAREAELAVLLTEKRAQLSGTKTEATELRAFVEAQADLERFRDNLRSQFPRYRALTESVAVPNATAFYHDHLAPYGQTLVHYFFGPARTYALTLGETGVKTTDLGTSDTLRVLVSRMLAYFTSASDIQNDPRGYANAAQDAYAAAILPLHLRPRQKLLIIPDGPLTYLPFPALLTSTPANSRLGEFPYLIREHPLTYGHSACILNRDNVDQGTPAEITAFAPYTDGSALLNYPTLLFNQDELSEISANFTTRLFKDSAATLADFRAVNTQARILHLSTHAFSSTEAQSPLIAFYDQALHLRELYHENLSADLVVLSACQTNVGQLAGGEGVLGLSRGFIQAGASSVIASLWNVNARGSSRILSNFYQHLAAGNAKGSSLNMAQTAYLNDDRIRDLEKSPYLWAGLTYYGAEGKLALYPVNDFKVSHAVLAAILLTLIAVLGLRMAKKYNVSSSTTPD